MIDYSDFLYTSDRRFGQQKLTQALREAVCDVTFNKADGTQRQMRCTLKPEIVNEFISEPEHTERNHRTTPKKPNDGLMTVFDLDVKDWRSFRFERIVEFYADYA